MNRLPLALVVVLAAGALAAIPDAVTGCAIAPHREQQVYTIEESALIVWDPATKTEHFVRRAHFRGTGYDFGFLVPTPNRPDLDVANDDLFGELANITAPRVEYREVVEERQKEFPLGCAMLKSQMEVAGMADKATPSAKFGGVDVLEQKRVGDYDAAVLVFRKGDGDSPERGAEELAKWLAKHGYTAPPAIEPWLAKYVKDEWCITAFKIAIPEPKKGGPNAAPALPPPVYGNDLQAKPIRMSFKAEKPFYPYREPATEPTKLPDEPRLLRVFVAAPARYAGKLGDGSKPWPGQTMWAKPMESPQWASVFQHAKLTDPPKKGDKAVFETPKAEGMWLTEFEDRSSPRSGTDEVYFEPATDTSPVERPPTIIRNTKIVMVTPWWHMVVYFGVPLALLLVGLVGWRLLNRKS
jgi:hypothetical protein